jgi:Fe2+ or Zn2+ uptake regulation protein
MEKPKRIALFNSPLEVALRLVFILNRSSRPLDMDRLVYYNYLLVHSSDIPNSPKSIHADLPKRSNEMPVSQITVKQALTLLIAKGLVSVNYSKSGIEYKKNESTSLFVSYFESPYSKQLQERADWLCSKFDDYSDQQISEIIKQNMERWGSELKLRIAIEG